MRHLFLTSMVVLLLTGCSQVPKKLEGNRSLVALDNFWDMLGGKKTPEEVKSESTKQ